MAIGEPPDCITCLKNMNRPHGNSWRLASPSLCPICNGKGIVPQGFYDLNIHDITATSGEQCRSCYGQGYLTN